MRQDIELGVEASHQIERQAAVVRNSELDAYLSVILRKLEKSKYARTLNSDGSRDQLFPFRIHVVYEKKINAFSLPGGPLFIHTGAIQAADNEAQLAGVIAHEMSHVVLRHMTNQASKRDLVALPAILASALAGNSLLGQLTRIGIGFTANSALLKFSRADEAEADYNGAEIMADAGYNPIEMARFFEKLEEKAGKAGAIEQFLSDHPNPGNRIAAISDEVRRLPRRNYVDDETGQFVHVRDVVKHLQAEPRKELARYEGRSFSLQYPDNWNVDAWRRRRGNDRPARRRASGRGRLWAAGELFRGRYRCADPELGASESRDAGGAGGARYRGWGTAGAVEYAQFQVALWWRGSGRTGDGGAAGGVVLYRIYRAKGGVRESSGDV